MSPSSVFLSRTIAHWLMAGLLCLTASLHASDDDDFFGADSDAVDLSFSGEHWNDSWGKENQPITAKLFISKLTTVRQGDVVEFRFEQTGNIAHKRKFPVQHWLIAKTGAISRVDAGEKLEHLEEWKKQGTMPEPEPGDLIFPPPAADHCFVEEEKKSEDESVTKTRKQWTWKTGPWTTEIRTDNGSTVHHLAYHNSGHFTSIVWRRGLGIIEFGMGSGAHQDGWRLYRTLPPARPIADKAPSVATLFAALPAEFMPVTTAFRHLADPAARASLVDAQTEEELARTGDAINATAWEFDPANGYLHMSSKTDGEGEALEAAVWRAKNGASLIGLHLKRWSSGPDYSLGLRLIEWRDGMFREITTSALQLPQLAEFYKEEDRAKVRLGGLIEGDWSLPKHGTSIVIRPGKEDEARTLDNVTSDEAYCFEMVWNGTGFEQITLPRALPAPAYEPEEWAFQGKRVEGPGIYALFLKRQGAKLSGELRAGSPATQTFPVTGELNPDGSIVMRKGSGKKVRETKESRLTSGTLGEWNDVELETDILQDTTLRFRALPMDTEAPLLPHFQITGQHGSEKKADVNIDYPKFDVPPAARTADWKAINAEISGMVQKERDAFFAALKKSTAVISKEDPANLEIGYEFAGIRADTLSIRFEIVGYTGGAHGQMRNIGVNHDFRAHKLLALADLFKAESAWPAELARLMEESMVAKGTAEAGKSGVTPELVKSLCWTLSPGNQLVFHIAIEERGPGTTDATVALPIAKLVELGIVRDGGALDLDR